MCKMRCNKKGATILATLLLVFMVLVLVGTALFYFYISQSANDKIAEARWIERVYVKESELKYYLFVAGENSLSGVSETDFDEAKFREKMSQEVGKIKNEESNFKIMKERVITNQYEIKKDGKKISLRLDKPDKFRIIFTKIGKNNKEMTKVFYKTLLETEILLKS